MAALLAWGLAGDAWAQASGPTPRIERPAEADCVVASDPERLLPEYPFLEYKERQPGRVKLELHFTGPSLRPAVKRLEKEGSDAFVDAAREYADRLRMPCMQVTETGVRLVQEYLFVPDQRQPLPSALEVAGGPRKQALMDCLKTASVSSNDYPDAALRRNLQGRVVVLAEYASADQPPTVTLHHRRSAAILAAAAERKVAQSRLPCFVAGQDEPLRLSYVYVYRLEDSAFGFKPVTLTELLPAVKDLRQQGLQLDTRSMGCPFELRWSYRQPGLPNLALQLDSNQASREPLLKWLRGVELQLPAQSLDSVYGDSADITVPCININIQPQPKETS